ncbi:ElyC/SanA/YdcF family protein [Microbacterium sp. NPDC087868]|uniref:ElyC/SanA/YdcF family protein n=1 Tax=Microbacterium sp. NPDC087868 TaxID=3364195 RepID=UPI00384F45F0
MKQPIRPRSAKVLTAALAATLVALATPLSATAATYPSDGTRPDSLDILGGYDAIWHSDGRGTMDGEVANAAAAAHNDELTVWINNHATEAQQLKALQDANYDAALLVGTGLGSTLQPIYINGLRGGQLPKTRELMNSMAGYADTDAAKVAFNYPRPFLATDPATTGVACDANTYNASSLAGIRTGTAYTEANGSLSIEQVPEMTDSSGVFTDPRTVGVGYGGYCASASFPSGHTTNSYLAGLTLATLVPELAPGILSRVSEMGTNRIVLGMHYPLDVMGGRIAGQALVAERWTDAAYRRDVIDPARDELVAYLETNCGDDLAACAATGTPFQNDPFAGAAVPGGTAQVVTDRASAITAFQERLTYGFAQTGPTDLAPSVPATASALLRSTYPTLTDAQRTEVLAQTQIESGYPLDRTGTPTGSWQRIDLAAAMTATVEVDDAGDVEVIATGTAPTVIGADGAAVLVLPDGDTVEVSTTLAFAASGLDAGADYRVVFDDDRATVLGSFRATTGGSVSGKVVIPADARTGTRTIALLRADDTVAATAGITVLAEQVYTISSEADLDLLRQHPDGTFELTADITMTARWTPVPVFTGELRGNGHVITGLEIVTANNQGFVAQNNGTIRGLGFVNPVSRLTVDASAAVVAANNYGTIDQVFVRGGVVTGGHRSGVIVSNNWGTVTNTYSTGRASGQWETGGITAWNDSSAIVRDNYTTVTVTAAYANVGSIAGVGNGGAQITGNVALAGAVQGTSGNAARLVGVGNPTLRDNLALNTITVNGWAVNGGSADNLQGAPKTARELQDAATFTALGWDFDTVWQWSDEAKRPVLRAVAEPVDVVTAPDAAVADAFVPRAISQMRNNLTADAALSAARMGDTSPALSAAWSQLIETWDAANTAFRINETVPAGLPQQGHVFIILGYALNNDGTAQPELIRRLEQAKAGLDAYPNSRIVVTGGVVRNGQTEAGVMRAWLLGQGISEDRIIFENAATDTPTNGINTMEMLVADPSITSYTLVSSASHLRRATVVFEAAALSAQMRHGTASAPVSVANLAYMDNRTSENPPSISERDSITQNVAKVWGVNVETDAYNGVQRQLVGRFVNAQRLGDAVDALRVVSQIRAFSPEYADRLADLAERWNGALTMTEFADAVAEVPAKGHTFIVPGSQLNDDGSLTETSLARLRIAVEALTANPGSTVTVVGGAARNGITEAGAQRTWLLANGVAADRIVVVDTSSSLVQGAQHAMLALSARGDSSYTVITSASVMRRTLAVYSSGATYAASHNADGRVVAESGHIAINDVFQLFSFGAPAADDGTKRTIAENIADVLGVRGEYNTFAANAPAVAALDAIALTAPTKSAYLVGDAFDDDGLAVIASYADGSTLDVTPLATVTGFDASSAGARTVTVTFTDRGETRSETFDITVRLADATALEQTIAEAAAITADGWTAASFAALQSALLEARAVAGDLGTDAATIARATETLRAAIDGLVESGSPGTDPGTDPGTGEGTDPGAGEGTTPGTGGGAADPDGLATTGGQLALGALALGTLLAAGGTTLVVARRRRAATE